MIRVFVAKDYMKGIYRGKIGNSFQLSVISYQFFLLITTNNIALSFSHGLDKVDKKESVQRLMP